MIAKHVMIGLSIFSLPLASADDPLDPIKELLDDCVGPVIMPYEVTFLNPLTPPIPNGGKVSDKEKGDFGEFIYIAPLPYGGNHLYEMNGSTVNGACADQPSKFSGMLMGDPYIYNPILCLKTHLCSSHD